ncbi:MAG TPA: DUF6476 family protein [Stellaceae bacterium]|nr:DUF6476 family protein [Stellaceae bacterium]
MRALKILVVVMGVIILAGFAALFIAVAGRMSHPRSAATPSGPAIAGPLELPAGAHIENMGVGADRLAVEIVLPDGNRQIVILDLASGRRLRTIPLRMAR